MAAVHTIHRTRHEALYSHSFRYISLPKYRKENANTFKNFGQKKLIQYHIIVYIMVYMISGHNIEYLCLNLFTLRRFNNNESSGGRQILLPLLGGDAPRLG